MTSSTNGWIAGIFLLIGVVYGSGAGWAARGVQVQVLRANEQLAVAEGQLQAASKPLAATGDKSAKPAADPTTDANRIENLRNLLAVHEAEAAKRNDEFRNDVEWMTEKEIAARIAYWNLEANPGPELHQSLVPSDGKIREAVKQRAYWRSVLQAKHKEP